MVESRAAVADPVDVAGGVTLAAGVTALLFAVLHRPGERDMGWIAAVRASSPRPPPR